MDDTYDTYKTANIEINRLFSLTHLTAFYLWKIYL
jgi:hypothetical protein